MGNFIQNMSNKYFIIENNNEYKSIVIKSLDAESCEIVVKNGWSHKNIICKCFGYEMSKDADQNYCLSKFNAFINESNSNLNVYIHGINDDGLYIVTFLNKFRSININNKMLLVDGIISPD